MEEKPIKSYSVTALGTLMKELNQPTFRAKQLAEWLYARHPCSYDEMTNLPTSLRSTLNQRFPLFAPEIIERSISQDGTRKYLIRFEDGVLVETVGIPSRDNQRLTVCFSTQAGCPMACAFCATGKEGFVRNLTPGEIVDQVLVVQEDFGTRVSNVVGMGQGEPFLNYDNTLAALHILNDEKLVGIGSRRMSISTCGIIPGIERFAEEPEQFTLAISVHSAVQHVRDALMPKVARYSIPDLKRALKHYVQKTNRRVTLEYLMIRDVNDSEEDLAAFKDFCSGLLCHVNLIAMNKIDASPLQPSNKRTIEQWISALQAQNIETTLRDSRGSDIAGACGQLKNTFLS